MIKLLLVLVLSINTVLAQDMEFQRSLNDRPWGWVFQDQQVRRGQWAQRFELRQGDCSSQPGWSDCLQDRERSEMSQQKPYIQLGSLNWYSWSIMLDSSWVDLTPVTVVLGQFHHRDSAVPAVLFVQSRGGLYLRLESAGSLYPGRTMLYLGDLSMFKGRWADLVVQARFSSSSDGILRVWVNGRRMVELLGPNTLGQQPLFFKYGIYRSYVSRLGQRAVQIAYYDELRRGLQRSDVDGSLGRIKPRD